MRKTIKVFFLFIFAAFLLNVSQVAASGNKVIAIDGAAIRVKTETSAQGLRFYAKLDESVKGNVHGFYLVYGEATVVELEDAIVEAGSGTIQLNGKEVFKVVVPGVDANNEYSVVLTGIPDVGYFDELSVIAYVEEGSNKVFVPTPITRSVARVVLNMANNGLDVSGVEAVDAITGTQKKKVAVNGFGKLEVSSGLFELNHFNLGEEFLRDWNLLFNTNLIDLDSATFFASAKEGSVDGEGANNNLSLTNLYKFFNDTKYKVKWGWLLNFLEGTDGTTHTTRQIVAIRGDGTNGEFLLYNGTHLSHSLTNFFNQEFEKGNYTGINFTELHRYEGLKTHNNKVYIDLAKYDLYSVGQSMVVPAAPSAKVGYNFANYKAGTVDINPGALYVIGDDIVFEAVYTPITYEVKFFDGANELTALAKTYNIETELTLAPAVKEGVTFRGWYDNAELTGDPVTKIAIGSKGDKVYYARWTDSALVTYHLGDYGYHTSPKTKAILFDEFMTDYKSVFGRGASVEDLKGAFFASSYLPEQYKLLDIFTHDNGKYAWLKEHLISLAVKDNYSGAADLLDETGNQAAWRTQIEAFFVEGQVTTSYGVSMDFRMEKNAHNFWQHTDYGVYEGDFVAGGALFNEVKTDSKIYGFAGFEDKDGTLVTVLPETGEGLELFARWERSAFYVNFNIGYNITPPETQLVLKNGKVVAPTVGERTNYTFAGWYLDLEDANPYDFNSPVTKELTLYAKWNEVTGGEPYTITYNLNGGKIIYGSKAELIDGFLEDFYAYLKLTTSITDFKHGVGKTSGYDGTWHSDHKEKLYGGPRPTAVNEEFFVSSATYMDKWLPFFDTVDEFIKVVNAKQYFWDPANGASTSVGFIRIRQYVMHVKPASYVTEETMNMVPEGGIEMPPITEGKTEIVVNLQTAYKEGFTFGGWYLTADFSGSAVTELNQTEATNVTLYAKFV